MDRVGSNTMQVLNPIVERVEQNRDTAACSFVQRSIIYPSVTPQTSTAAPPRKFAAYKAPQCHV